MSPGIDKTYFREINPGIQAFDHRFSLPRHRHLSPYATVILAGSLEESGYNGRIRATAGDVLIHPPMDCHGNQLVPDGLKLIRLSWHEQSGGLYYLDNIDEIARAAENDCLGAAQLLRESLCENRSFSKRKQDDWPDMLLADLRNDPTIHIGLWAEINGLARETVSRCFTSAYGVTPSVLRAELRVCSAWFRITQSAQDLSRIALEAGFADQAHMTRWIRRVTGASPTAWRRNAAAPDSPLRLPSATNNGRCRRTGDW